MVARKVRLSGMVLLAAGLVGCSAGSGNRLAVRPEPPPNLRPENVTVARIVEKINQNAQPAQAMIARPSITANSRIFRTGGLSGKIVLEKRGNFMMELDKPVTGSPVVHLGSNDKEYWLWMRDENDGAVLVGDYRNGSDVASEMMFQPDWVIEALGLRTISPAEESRIKSEPGPSPGTLLLTHYRDNGQGSTTIKQTVVDERTGRPLKHLFYAGDQRRPVAVATVSDPAQVPVQDGSETPRMVEIPRHIELRISPTENRKEDSKIAMSLNGIQIRPALDEEARQAWFSVPGDLGKVVHVDNTAPAYAAGGDRGRSYRSRPSPPPASLGTPEPIGADGGSLNWSDPMPLGPDLRGPSPPADGVSAIIQPGIPEATDGLSLTR